MFTITTKQGSTGTGGVGTITAKAQGRQRTVRHDHAYSVEVNHARAAGALLNVLASPEQQAKVRHPSGGQRVQVHSVSDAGGKYRWDINV